MLQARLKDLKFTLVFFWKNYLKITFSIVNLWLVGVNVMFFNQESNFVEYTWEKSSNYDFVQLTLLFKSYGKILKYIVILFTQKFPLLLYYLLFI